MVIAGLIIANAVVTYRGLSEPGFMDRYSFRIAPIRDGKEYIRLLSSGFLHVHWPHFAINMYTLYVFGFAMDYLFGVEGFLLIYFGSLLGGDLLALYIRRNDSMYSAVGASGAISGVVYAFVLMLPTLKLYLFFVLPIPAWLLGIGYLLYTIYGVKTRMGNIGHEAHLGGAILGMVIAFLLQPDKALANWWILLLLGVPTVVFLYATIYNPSWLNIGTSPLGKKSSSGGQYWSRNYSRSSAPGVGKKAYSSDKKIIDLKPGKNLSPQQELDILLDKVRLKGIDSLSKKEKARLEQLSKDLG